MSAYDIDLRGDREVRAMLDQFTGRQLQNRIRRMARAGAGVFRRVLRDRAHAGDFPATFAKTSTKAHRNPIGVSVRPVSPLVNIFEGGAQQHSIGGPGQLLANPDAGFAARGPVSHPGMNARPLVGPSFDQGRDEAEDAIEDALWAGVR